MQPRLRLASPRTLAALVALMAAPLAAQAKPTPTADAAAPSTEGLPSFLLPVPAGSVQMGMTIDQLIQAACEAINPRRPELALKEPDRLALRLRQTASQLGQERRDVPAFLLGKWPAKNGEYQRFLETMAKQGVKVRPPFHWWRYGKKDDYDQKLADIAREFKADGKMGPVLFWERYGEDLPYALKDDKGNAIDDMPVVYLSRRDAVRWAGWLGMRLPTEEEWTRAARGDGQQVWPWGANKELGDKFQEAILDQLKLNNMRDRTLKQVGSTSFASGPFGHFDMAGQIWEFTAQLGFGPICGQKAFEAEWKRTQKDKVGQLLKDIPLWKDDGCIVKGGSYLSAGDPIQFQIDCRFRLQNDEVLEGVGVRFAKSMRPGYDQLLSLVSSDYNQDLFEVGANVQSVDFDGQVGAERYVLDDSGYPLEYHALSFAPVNWLSAEKSTTMAKVEERSRTLPLLVGTLSSTEPMLEPKLPAGIYSVAFRAKGMTKELKDAIKAGYKDVQNELKRKQKGGEAKEEDKPEVKKGDWRTVLNRFGITDADLEPKGADTSIDFIRLDGYQVPTEQALFLFYDNNGKWVGHCKADGIVAGSLAANEVAFGADKQGKAKVEFKVRATMLKDQKKGVEYKLDLTLDQDPPKAGEVWRLPTVTSAGG